MTSSNTRSVIFGGASQDGGGSNEPNNNSSLPRSRSAGNMLSRSTSAIGKTSLIEQLQLKWLNLIEFNN